MAPDPGARVGARAPGLRGRAGESRWGSSRAPRVAGFASAARFAAIYARSPRFSATRGHAGRIPRSTGFAGLVSSTPSHSGAALDRVTSLVVLGRVRCCLAFGWFLDVPCRCAASGQLRRGNVNPSGLTAARLGGVISRRRRRPCSLRLAGEPSAARCSTSWRSRRLVTIHAAGSTGVEPDIGSAIRTATPIGPAWDRADHEREHDEPAAERQEAAVVDHPDHAGVESAAASRTPHRR